ncbi:MAG: M48 family metallopeptidase [Christensenellaceae bacterium]|jgi:predicted metal-dependent hydrolase|nr:M48 family metallopeptidase [Christensenellaceae bacterium]
MVNPANIYRSKRNTLSIYIDPTGELIVRAPLGMTDRKIFDFIKSRGDWIAARKEAVQRNAFINRNVASYNTFFFLGTELVPVINNSAKQITREARALVIPGKIENDKILKKVEKYFRDHAKVIVAERCQYFSERLKLKFNTANINNNKTRWGSCTKTGDIAINWRAVMLAPNVLDYIIVHEFCHLLEFNHTKNFWAVVQTILPDWKRLRLELKHLSWLLQLFR